MAENIPALDFDGRTIFGVADTGGDLITIDPATGEITPIGPIASGPDVPDNTIGDEATERAFQLAGRVAIPWPPGGFGSTLRGSTSSVGIHAWWPARPHRRRMVTRRAA